MPKFKQNKVEEYLRKFGVYWFAQNGHSYRLEIFEMATLRIYNKSHPKFVTEQTKTIIEINDLSKILDYLKEELDEEQFKEVEKFCFERL